jgi:O-antigen ligase
MVLLFFHLVILEGRGGYLTFILLSPMILLNLIRSLGLLKTTITVIVLLGLIFLSPIVRERASLTIDEIQYHINAPSESAWGGIYSHWQDRFYMWNKAVKIFLAHPFIGIGTGGYQTEMARIGDPEAPPIAHPHNNILYMAVSFGILGIIVLFWFFWEIMSNAWKERKTPLGYFILSVALVIFVSGFVNTQILDANTAFFLAIATGLQQGLKQFSNATS